MSCKLVIVTSYIGVWLTKVRKCLVCGRSKFESLASDVF